MSATKSLGKDSLLSPVTTPQIRPRRSLLSRFAFVVSLCTFCFAVISWSRFYTLKKFFNSVAAEYRYDDESADYGYLCPQAGYLAPAKNAELWNHVLDKAVTPEFKDQAIKWLSGAVQVKTESYDDLGAVGVDPRWEVFGPFHEYLFNSFPLVHSTLKLTKVNTWGLVYHFQGSDDTLKPVLFAAHQDVVPVNPDTVDQWAHPPYSGYFDGEDIWGRGSSDDKGGLIGVLASVETLIEMGFKPTRTIVLAFGFDEETSGSQGAGHLAEYLIDSYGLYAFGFIIDEGGGFEEHYGTVYATPAVIEKGHLDIRLEISSPGGHSSIPPAHTSIGILAALLVEYEANPSTTVLTRDSITHDTVKCLAAYSPKMPGDLRKAIIQSTKSDSALKEATDILLQDNGFKSMVVTTQAVDLIGGGVKINALPENAWAVINHRIDVSSSVHETITHATKIIMPLTEKFNFSLTAFGIAYTDPSLPTWASLVLSDAFGTALEPAPLTPYVGPDSTAYQILSGTIKSTYNAHRSINGDHIKVRPGYMTGNTDTHLYWDLSHSIFRYNHHNYIGMKTVFGNIHTVNESIAIDAFFEMIKFFTTLILNADEAQNL